MPDVDIYIFILVAAVLLLCMLSADAILLLIPPYLDGCV